MTTLYAALAASLWTREGKVPPMLSPEALHAPDGTPWAILYDLDQQEFVFDDPQNAIPHWVNLDLFADSGPQKRPLLPLSILFDDAGYDDWRAKANLSREQVNRARSLRSAFSDYLIPLLPLATDDIGVVTLTFKRVNSGGTPMGDADMTRALAWSEGFDLRERLGSVRERLRPLGWGELEDDAILKVIAAVSLPDPTEFDAEELAQKIRSEPSRVLAAEERIVAAVRLLGERIGIRGPGSLPYIQTLVFAARAIDQAGGVLAESQESALVAWVAEVCLDERFGGAQPHMIRAHFRALAHRLDLPTDTPLRARSEKKSTANECWVFSMAWARSRGTALVLADQEPVDSQGRPFRDPYALVARGSDCVAMLFAVGADGIPPLIQENLKSRRLATALRAPANRVVCPPWELPALRVRILSVDCPLAVLRHHLISFEAHEALRAGDLERFFEIRRISIIEAEGKWVKARGGVVDLLKEPRSYAPS